MKRRCTPVVLGAAALLIGSSIPRAVEGQQPVGVTVLVTVRVCSDTTGTACIEAATVRGGGWAGVTNASGEVTASIPAGTHWLVATKIGYTPDSARVALRAGVDTSVVIVLVRRPTGLDAMVVSATRSERRVEDTPIRVETIDGDEIAEKVTMSPGDIAMMLNETGGLRVQATNPSLGGANVRIQGLRGRYSLLLADGLPLYGAQAGGLGLLQIPPVDLERVEIIKGTASALYGSSALGGVIDLVSRRPGAEAERTALVNQTSRGGTDAVFFGSTAGGARTGATLLAGVHRQRQNDLDDDGWTDMPGYGRVVVRPRVHLGSGERHTAFITAGFTGEEREGGTLAGRVTPDGSAFRESLRTRRADAGALARFVGTEERPLFAADAFGSAVLTLRGSGVEQRHSHAFGVVREVDRHRTWFGEAALVVPVGGATYVTGVAVQRETYRADQVPGFDYAFTIPALLHRSTSTCSRGSPCRRARAPMHTACTARS